MSPRLAGAALAALTLAACASQTPPGPAPGAPPPAPRPPVAEAPPERTLPLGALPGWRSDDHLAAYDAFRQTCGVARDPGLAQACREARAIGPLDPEHARGFFEAHFRAEPLAGAGVLTAYYAPVYAARHAPDAEFNAAVRAKPSDLKVVAGQVEQLQPDGSLAPYPDRAAIEAGPPEKALAWMRPEELFFLQVQGSGVLTFEDGSRRKALYAANNGRPFVGVGNLMRDRGLLPPDGISGEAIRQWLADHRGPDADAVMQANPRYAWFSLAPDDGKPPVGAAGVALPPGRALAVDPSYHAMGELLWLDGESPLLNGAFPHYRRLALALDTGGAIKGPVRADLYLGQGQAAGVEAGRVRHTLRLWRLVPKDAAR